jgi:hypothetical protein
MIQRERDFIATGVLKALTTIAAVSSELTV